MSNNQNQSASSGSSIVDTRTLRSQTSQMPIVVNVPVERDVIPEIIEPNIEINRQWKKKDVITAELPQYDVQQLLYNENMFAGCKTATDIFLKFIHPIVDNIIFQSNLYATQNDKNLKLTEKELYAFLGINFCMGYNKLPSYKLYWNTSEDLHVRSISKAMSRDRFREILSNIHVNDNANLPNNNKDKLYKLRPMIDTLNTIFPEAYYGTRELSVDESMIKFKGRSTIKQYNPMKPIKRGYKLWCIADQNGYILKYSVYQGKNETLEQEFDKYNLGERVVLMLTKPFWKQQRIIIFDNYFTSITLLERLKNEQTLACGTIRNNRKGMPQNLKKDSDIKRGDFDHRFSTSGIVIFKWKDNKVVYLASNYHGNETTTVQRTSKDGSKSNVTCPTLVKDYNAFMGGVDHADRLRALYCVDRKSKKWWLRIFWGLLDIVFVNAYVVYCQIFGQMDVLEVRRSIALGLMSECDPTSKRSICLKRTPPNTPSNRRKKAMSIVKDVRLGNRGIHWPAFGSKRGRCELCSIRGVESRPTSTCSHCRVFLCCNEKKNCFVDYHQIDISKK
ncbi:piggyBac transposable element-derived protein 3-like [Melanaphis sacchari]|uniref:piggyBac transposable element-derived protein 3-like n=1 Tax=Melanaphis sacchari TaxID=742174 RepID=UPI000DC159AB|nr:piggyBac transposable element-derived protein 3-like [Melanaphis sacchari]